MLEYIQGAVPQLGRNIATYVTVRHTILGNLGYNTSPISRQPDQFSFNAQKRAGDPPKCRIKSLELGNSLYSYSAIACASMKPPDLSKFDWFMGTAPWIVRIDDSINQE